MSTMSDLPHEIHSMLLDHLDGVSLARAEQACQQWKELSLSKCRLWRDKCMQEIGVPALLSLTGSDQFAYLSADKQEQFILKTTTLVNNSVQSKNQACNMFWKEIYKEWYTLKNVIINRKPLRDSINISGAKSVKIAGETIFVSESSTGLLNTFSYYDFKPVHVAFRPYGRITDMTLIHNDKMLKYVDDDDVIDEPVMAVVLSTSAGVLHAINLIRNEHSEQGNLLRVSDSHITCLSSFGDLVAFGNRTGSAGVCQLKTIFRTNSFQASHKPFWQLPYVRKGQCSVSALSLRDKMLLVGSSDGTIQLFNVETSERIVETITPNDSPGSSDFTHLTQMQVITNQYSVCLFGNHALKLLRLSKNDHVLCKIVSFFEFGESEYSRGLSGFAIYGRLMALAFSGSISIYEMSEKFENWRFTKDNCIQRLRVDSYRISKLDIYSDGVALLLVAIGNNKIHTFRWVYDHPY